MSRVAAAIVSITCVWLVIIIGPRLTLVAPALLASTALYLLHSQHKTSAGITMVGGALTLDLLSIYAWPINFIAALGCILFWDLVARQSKLAETWGGALAAYFGGVVLWRLTAVALLWLLAIIKNGTPPTLIPWLSELLILAIPLIFWIIETRHKAPQGRPNRKIIYAAPA